MEKQQTIISVRNWNMIPEKQKKINQLQTMSEMKVCQLNTTPTDPVWVEEETIRCMDSFCFRYKFISPTHSYYTHL